MLRLAVRWVAALLQAAAETICRRLRAGFIVRCVSDGKRCRQMNSCFALGHVQLDTRVSRGGNWDDSAHCFAECAKQCETAVRHWPLPAVNAGGHKSTAVSETRQQPTNRQC